MFSATRMMSTADPPVAAPLSFIGANAAISNTVTLPAHEIGDLIVVFAWLDSFSVSPSAPSKPSAGGTVPTWTDIDATAGANFCASRTAYTVATATNHTSGSWTGGNNQAVCAVVLRNPNASPIGGHAESGGTALSGATAPAITLADSDGSSVLLHFFGRRAGGLSSWSAAPAGYTSRAATTSGVGVTVITKDVTTSDGSITHASAGNSVVGYRGATVEILN